MSARRRVNGSRPSGGGVPWGGDTASDLIAPLDTNYDALTQEPWRSLLSLPGDDNGDDDKEGGEEGAGPILPTNPSSKTIQKLWLSQVATPQDQPPSKLVDQ